MHANAPTGARARTHKPTHAPMYAPMHAPTHAHKADSNATRAHAPTHARASAAKARSRDSPLQDLYGHPANKHAHEMTHGKMSTRTREQTNRIPLPQRRTTSAPAMLADSA